MKRIENFYRSNPSYTKWGTMRVATKTGLSVTTVERFKKTDTYKTIKQAYLSKLN